MDKAHVRIHIQAGQWPGEANYAAVVPLKEPLVLHKLDWPNPDDDGLSRMLCSDTATIRTVMRSRLRIAEELTPVIVKALMDAMGAQDTECGYPKEQKA